MTDFGLRNTESTGTSEPRRQAPPFWLEIGCFALFFVQLLVTCAAMSVISWSATVPYHGDWTWFHIISMVIVSIHGATVGIILLQLPFRLSPDESNNGIGVSTPKTK